MFDLGHAHDLYNALVAPVEALVRDRRHLLLVPSGPLTALPFHLLVTAKPAVPVPSAVHRLSGRCLAGEAALPPPCCLSIASLKALRVLARKDQAHEADDRLRRSGVRPRSPAAPCAATVASQTRGYTDFWQGVSVDRAKLAQALPRLTATADELKAIAQKLGAPASDIHLRQAASETTLKRTRLLDYRVVYFATHGLVAGDVKGLAEPSLALTIPKAPSEADDGLLTASEIAQLKLNADWVVLSACNTIAGDKPGAEALSGLARAFFYAGRPRAPGVALGGRFERGDAAHHRDLRHHEERSDASAAPRRCAAPCWPTMNDASNPRNAYPGLLGAVRGGGGRARRDDLMSPR